MHFPALAAAMLLLSAPAFAQSVSLAEVARQEQARRAGLVKKATRVLTNADLAPATGEPSASAPSTGGFESVSTGGNASADEIIARSVATVDGPTDISQNEATWRARAGGLRGQVDAARKDLAALETPSSSADPREHKMLDNVRRRAKGRLERAEAAWTRFETEASTAKIPKDWITTPQ